MSEGRILIADDESSIRRILEKALQSAGHETSTVADGIAALEKLRGERFDLAIVDIRMPKLGGLELLSRIHEEEIDVPVLLITAESTMANAIEAMKRGAFDYVTKPFDLDEVQMVVDRALKMEELTRMVDHLQDEMRRQYTPGEGIVGRTPAMQEIYKTIGRVAHSNATVLVTGESGTGKELIARALHFHSGRPGPFVALNCSAIPRDLLESQLFGHERGAFTGAVDRQIGSFERANRGTIFFDEIGEMPIELQSKLLRVLQEREFTRVGGRETLHTDVRIVAATNQSLERMVREKTFREDLYFRLSVVPIVVPPLRNRREDVPELIHFFIRKINDEVATDIRGVSPKAEELLSRHSWPGNVRQLENTLRRACVLASGRTLTVDDFDFEGGQDAATSLESSTLDELLGHRVRDVVASEPDGGPGDLHARMVAAIERPLLEAVLERTGGNQLRAAEILGINRNTLRKKLNQLSIRITS